MNFNASRNMGGVRKAKRVSDVSAVGSPAPPPPYSPGPAFDPGFAPTPAFDPGFAPTPAFDPGFAPTQPPAYQEGIQLDPSLAYGSPMPNNNFNGYMPVQPPMNAQQVGAVLQAPMVQAVALQYGQHIANHGRDLVNREFEKYVPVTKLRYYFAVDTRYVMKKLILIFFPFTHKDWSVKYDQDNPVQPRYDLNAPDLYIPSMAYVTYVLLAGFMMGLQHRFSPEQIGAQASRALAYIIFEILLYLVTLYITNTNTNLKTLDLLAFSSYKYTVMIGCLLASLLLRKTGYYAMLLYTSFTLSFFLVKTLRVQVLAGSQAKEPASYGYTQNPYIQPESAGGTKRRLYFLLFVAVTQPLLSWWLTFDLVPAAVAGLPEAAAL